MELTKVVLVLFVCLILSFSSSPCLPDEPDSTELGTEQLIADLSHGSTEAKLEALYAFSDRPVQDEIVIPKLIALLGDERFEPHNALVPVPPRTVGQQAAYTLEAYGAASVPLVTQQLTHRRKNVRRRAAMVLQRIGLPDAGTSVDLIAKAYESESDESARIQMLVAFDTLELRQPNLESLILNALEDESGQVFSTALNIIAKRELHHPRIVAKVIDAMNDNRTYWFSHGPPDMVGSESVKALARETLGRIGKQAREASVKLRIHLNSNEEVSGRLISAYALFRVSDADDEALNFLMNEAENTDIIDGNSTYAIYWLGELGSSADRAWPLIVRHCQLSAEFLKPEAESKEELEWLIHRRRQNRRRISLTTADKIRGVGSLSLQREALKSPLPKDREHAAKLIAGHGKLAADAVPELNMAVLDDRGDSWESRWSRSAAAEALGEIGPLAVDAIGTLEEIAAREYESWDLELRESALEALTKIRN